MGCDIHCYMEYVAPMTDDPSQYWWHSFGGQIRPGRNYHLFGKLAEVRGGTAIFPPRGIPKDDLGSAARDDYYYFVTSTPGDECVTKEKAEAWVKIGQAEWRDDKQHFVSNPDWHSASWLTTAELLKVLEGEDLNLEWEAIKNTLLFFEQAGQFLPCGRGCRARLVFWFDN